MQLAGVCDTIKKVIQNRLPHHPFQLRFPLLPVGHLLGQQRIKLIGVIMMYQMTKFMGNDVFNWSCMVNVYLKEDKYFRAHSDRRRKIFIFANCMTQNKGKQEKPL